MNGRDSKGVNWEEEKRKRTETRDFEDEYEELHFRTERISRPPKEGDLFHEGRQEANIQSDGETGRLLTHSHKELFRCDCGCIVENIRQTVRDASGKVFCEKHGSLFCRLCSQLIMASRFGLARAITTGQNARKESSIISCVKLKSSRKKSIR